MSYQLKAEKTIERSASDVFRALGEGRLFLNCGASSDMKVDFRVGGKYNINFKNHGVTNFGEFLEIIPNKKIVFNWCQTFGENQKPDTTVTIELFADGPRTKLVLIHTGFNTQDGADNHTGGWNSGLTDMTHEIQDGRLRMIRVVAAPLEKTFELCKNSPDLGKLSDMTQNQKMMFLSPAGQVTILFSKKDENSTKLEMLCEGASIKENALPQRKALESAAAHVAQSFAQ
ncbi:MAG: SRPBCC domain-containing protein [Bdellovibrionaceae bacterium]|nr:SRPBCC domain-containing protein [Pseudobdellovibrionaceae bacterium]